MRQVVGTSTASLARTRAALQSQEVRLAQFCALTFFITDPAKDADREALLVILGAKVFYSFAEAWVASTIDDHKAEKWLLELEEIISQHKCDPDKAGKCAGRFSWACTVAIGKIG